jgi:hypothetical protein
VSTTVRNALIVLGTALVIAALIAAAARPDSGEERSPGVSSTDGGPAGLTIYAALLAEAGHEVSRAGDPPAAGDLDPGETAILLGSGSIGQRDGQALRELVEEGGRLVLGGFSEEAIERATGLEVTQSAGSSGAAAPLVPVAETAGVASLEAAGSRFSEVGEALPIAGGPGGEVAALATAGEGTVVLLADPALAANDAIADLDNARVAVNLAGPVDREVVFVESLGSAEVGTGFAALPDRWPYALFLLLLAAAAMIAARVRRLGEPDSPGRELPPPRSRYTDALASALTKSGQASRAADPIRREALRRLAAEQGLGEDPGSDALRRAAARAGLEPEEFDALVEPKTDEADTVRAGQALSKLWK